MTPRARKIPAGAEPVNAFVCTIDVKNIDESIAKVKKAGGTISFDKMDVPNVGILAYCKDIEGNMFGMLQPNI